MSQVKLSIVIKESDLHVRKRRVPSCKAFRDKTKYTRKAKHKNTSPEDACPA